MNAIPAGGVEDEVRGQISPGLWLACFACGLVLVLAVNFAVAYQMDVFGIFRDPMGRELVTPDHERKAKYLLNQHYVPENFDSLVIGASASVNWDLMALKGFRFYNESMEGADATEERRLVEEALNQGHFRVALVVLHPVLTQQHLLQDGFDQAKVSEALGSLSSLTVEYSVLESHFRKLSEQGLPDGSKHYPFKMPPPAVGVVQVEPVVDPVAVEDYRALVTELMAHGVRVIYVTYPLYEPTLKLNLRLYADYNAALLAHLPNAPLIDFAAPQFVEFRSNPENYFDEIHLSGIGSERLSKMLNEQMQTILQGR